MTAITTSIEVNAPLATVVHEWPKRQRLWRQVPEAFATFQGLADERTRVKLCVERQPGLSTLALELVLGEELDRFKHVVEADVSDRTGLFGWLSRTVWRR